MQVLQDFHKIAVVLCLSLLPLSGCEQRSEAPRMTAKTLAATEALLDDVARTETALNPQIASRLGLDIDYARDARRKLNGTSQAAFERSRLLRLDLQARLAAGPRMSGDHALSRDLLITMNALQQLINLQKSGHGRLSLSEARPYTIDPFAGLWIEGPETLVQDHIIETPQDAEDYLFRLSALADGLQDTRRRLQADAQTGHLPPAPLLQETRIRMEQLQADTALTAIIETLSDFTASLVFETEETRETLILTAQKILNEDIRPAYQNLIQTLSELEPQAPIPAGLWAQTGGVTLYRDLVTTLAEPGLNLESTYQELQNDLAALKQVVVEAPTQAEATTETTPPSPIALEEASPVVPAIAGIVRTYMPTSRPSVTGVHFRPARLDDRRPALTELDASQLAAWPLYFQMVYTDQHRLEAELAYDREVKQAAMRSPVRGVIQREGFHSGWLIYRQKQTLAVPDQYLLFITVLAAADLGLHYQRWSLEETVTFIQTETSLTSELSRDLALRIAANPAAALSTYVHYARFVSLETRTRQVLDQDFNQTHFNTALLTDGPRPLALVERDIESWYQAILDARN
jgi:uncharacterized protein (DUF885 family)